jgi:hypothetical protein
MKLAAREELDKKIPMEFVDALTASTQADGQGDQTLRPA